MLVQLAMVEATHRNSELIADLAAERPMLGKTEMVRIGRCAAAHQAWLGGNEFAVVFVAQANGLGRHAATADDKVLSQLLGALRHPDSVGPILPQSGFGRRPGAP